MTLHRLALEGAQGDALFRQQFGIPLSTALALLTDLEGDIHLDVPVRIEPGGAQVDVVAVVASALKAAFIGAALSPLKMLGAVAGGLGSGGEAPAEPPPAEMVVGRAELSPAGVEHLGRVASLLADRPALAVDLAGLVSADDVRFLAEQKVRVKLAKNEIDFEAITGLLSRAARKRVLEALNERAVGKRVELSADDQKLLDALLEDADPPTPADRRALAERRVEQVIDWLRSERGIDAERLHPATGETIEPTAPCRACASRWPCRPPERALHGTGMSRGMQRLHGRYPFARASATDENTTRWLAPIRCSPGHPWRQTTRAVSLPTSAKVSRSIPSSRRFIGSPKA